MKDSKPCGEIHGAHHVFTANSNTDFVHSMRTTSSYSSLADTSALKICKSTIYFLTLYCVLATCTLKNLCMEHWEIKLYY